MRSAISLVRAAAVRSFRSPRRRWRRSMARLSPAPEAEQRALCQECRRKAASQTYSRRLLAAWWLTWNSTDGDIARADLIARLTAIPGSAQVEERGDGLWISAPQLDVEAMAREMKALGCRLVTMTGLARDDGETTIIYHYARGHDVDQLQDRDPRQRDPVDRPDRSSGVVDRTRNPRFLRRRVHRPSEPHPAAAPARTQGWVFSVPRTPVRPRQKSHR